MTHSMQNISVVICAYTEARWDDLVAAVESVRQQTRPPREIIVVIDHNPALLKRARAVMPDVLVMENQEAHGASGSRNCGVAAAQGAVIAFLDDDAEAAPDWLEQLMVSYASPNVLGVGGTLEPVWLGGRPQWFPDEFNWVVGCTYTGLPQKASPVRNLIAANMSMRRQVFESVGGFRSGYGNMKSSSPKRSVLFRSCAGDEETELCIRALGRYPQGIWLHQPEARVRHKVPVARGQARYYLKRCYDEGFGKALLSQFVGAKDGLASERVYTLHTLPRGVVRGICDALFHFDLAGLGRAGAIIVGLAITVAGYLMGFLSTRLQVKKSNPANYAAGRGSLPGESS